MPSVGHGTSGANTNWWTRGEDVYPLQSMRLTDTVEWLRYCVMISEAADEAHLPGEPTGWSHGPGVPDEADSGEKFGEREREDLCRRSNAFESWLPAAVR